ncbi:MAG: hypothetical protein GXO10_05140 [Crenarchaeota archaeon]|nr:hypothetical protein [Thermoproteota archaeon]
MSWVQRVQIFQVYIAEIMEKIVEYSTLSYLIPLIITIIASDDIIRMVFKRILTIYGISFILIISVLGLLLILLAVIKIFQLMNFFRQTSIRRPLLMLVSIDVAYGIALILVALHTQFFNDVLTMINGYVEYINSIGFIKAITLELVFSIFSCALLSVLTKHYPRISTIKYAATAYIAILLLLIFWALNISAGISTLIFYATRIT